MEEERDRAEFKHVCKLCNKRYPSGKSLGGHMRSHVIANAQKAKALLKNKAPAFDADFDQDDGEDDEINEEREKNGSGHSGYGLRENPKKTWRAADSNLNPKNGSNSNAIIINSNNNNQQQQNQQERVCKQCGKAFQSLKALCGHMSSHSERERHFKDEEEDDRSWSSENHSDHHLNTHNNHPDSISSKRQTRSSYSRYRSLTAVDSPVSNNSEIDQLEQEEVAICLMMLSRDSSCGYRNVNCFNFAAESSDNNSVILEGGSSSNAANGIGKRKEVKLVNSSDKFKQVGSSDQKLNVALEMDNSDSGYFENGAKELESDGSVDGFYVKNYYCYSSYGTNKNNPKSDQFVSGLVDSSDGSKKRVRDVNGFSFESPESDENSTKKIKLQDFHESSYNNHRGNFRTHQSLGSHNVSHRKHGERSLETNNSPKITPNSKAIASNYAKKVGVSSKKVKGHKCPYCPKVFKSGQALGGHKRSHMMSGGGGGSRGLLEDKLTTTLSPSPSPEPEPEPKPEFNQLGSSPLIDLNLPAPVDEEGSGNSQFVAW